MSTFLHFIRIPLDLINQQNVYPGICLYKSHSLKMKVINAKTSKLVQFCATLEM